MSSTELSDKLKAILSAKKIQRTQSHQTTNTESDIQHEVHIQSFRQQQEFGPKKRIKP